MSIYQQETGPVLGQAGQFLAHSTMDPCSLTFATDSTHRLDLHQRHQAPRPLSCGPADLLFHPRRCPLRVRSNMSADPDTSGALPKSSPGFAPLSVSRTYTLV